VVDAEFEKMMRATRASQMVITNAWSANDGVGAPPHWLTDPNSTNNLPHQTSQSLNSNSY
jgi:hypothetical protein